MARDPVRHETSSADTEGRGTGQAQAAGAVHSRCIGNTHGAHVGQGRKEREQVRPLRSPETAHNAGAGAASMSMFNRLLKTRSGRRALLKARGHGLGDADLDRGAGSWRLIDGLHDHVGVHSGTDLLTQARRGRPGGSRRCMCRQGPVLVPSCLCRRVTARSFKPACV